MMHVRALQLALVVSFLFGYMEWGQGQSAFLAQTEYDLFFRRDLSPDSIAHPLVLLPLGGQVILLINAFLSMPRRRLATVGTFLMGILALLILLAGTLSRNAWMCLSVVPFLGLVVVHFRKPQWYPAR